MTSPPEPTGPCHLTRGLAPFLLAFVCLISVFANPKDAPAQDKFQNFDASNIYAEIDQQVDTANVTVNAWWDKYVSDSLRNQQPIEADIHSLLFLAINNSNQIKIAKRDPLIRQTAIQEADSAFDWTRYLNTAWNDTSEPIGNQLTAGGTATQFNDHQLIGTSGVRRTTRNGGQLDISQRLGWQDNNSQFLTPDEQATGRFTISYTHPLLRGNGFAYNNALVFLAQVDSDVAQQSFLATLQDELLEITRSYWSLYLERALLAQQMSLFLKTKEIYETLSARQQIDAGRTQLITAASALETRRANLIRSRTAVANAETRLRGLINASELGNSDAMEIIPIEGPSAEFYPVEMRTELENAMQNRPEVAAAIQEVRAGSKRLGIAKHELMPALNLVTEGYLSGLRGDGDFAGTLADQFSEGAPSYSVGFQYEMPIGNRAARARLCRRQQELAQLNDQYARALQIVQTEVDIAVRELVTAYREIGAKGRALVAAETEAETIRERWKTMADGNGTGALNLESLLRALERVMVAEGEYSESLVTYNLAMINLKRANGSLLQSEAVTVQQVCENGCLEYQLNKGNPNVELPNNFSQFEGMDSNGAPEAVVASDPATVAQTETAFSDTPLEPNHVVQPSAVTRIYHGALDEHQSLLPYDAPPQGQ